MRTTIDLPDDVLAELKKRAAESNRSLKSVVEDALRQALVQQRGSGPKAPPVRLTVFGATGLQPGVDLDDAASLLDLMS